MSAGSMRTRFVLRAQMNYSVYELMPSNRSAQGVPNSGSASREEHKPSTADAGYSRETVLLSCIALLLVMVVLTAFIARMYHKQEHVLADRWSARGEAQLRDGNALEAAKDYRNALVYSESNTAFQFHLAQALTAVNKKDTDAEARSYLLNLLAESPGSGEINLELAHISARQQTGAAIQDTQRYYFGAIYGVWDGNPLPKRWNARLELCEYLLAHGMVPQAQPQAIALSQDVSVADLGRQKIAAALLMRTGLWDRALQEYRVILASHRHDPDALAGEGMAAFHLGQYARAVQDLSELSRGRRDQPEIGAALAESREVEAISPFLNGLAVRDSASRAVEALTRANVLLQNCSRQVASASPSSPAPANPPTAKSSTAKSAPSKKTKAAPTPTPTAANDPLAQLRATFAQNSRAWRELNFVRHPEQIDAAMSWVFHVENAAAQACGPSPLLIDRALVLIAKSRGGSNA